MLDMDLSSVNLFLLFLVWNKFVLSKYLAYDLQERTTHWHVAFYCNWPCMDLVLPILSRLVLVWGILSCLFPTNLDWFHIKESKLQTFFHVYRAIQESNCYHKYGHEASCEYGDAYYMLLFGVVQILLSQLPDFHNIQWLSVFAAIMSFTYALIGFGLGIAKVIGMIVSLLIVEYWFNSLLLFHLIYFFRSNNFLVTVMKVMVMLRAA